MELWLDLLFGNPVGLFSVITVATTIAVIVFIFSMLFWRSSHTHHD